MKWFNRLCYLVATEICMVRTDPRTSWRGHGLGWGDQKGFRSLSIPESRAGLGTPPGHQVSPGLPAVTFPLWAEPGTGLCWPLTEGVGDRSLQELRASLLPSLCLSARAAAHAAGLTQDLEVETT